jgi:restriction system protein
MARRQGLLTELFETGFKLPWWVSGLLAIVVYVLFHVIAIQTASPATGTTLADMGTVAQHALLHTLALFLQYVIPAGLLIGDLGSLIVRARSRLLLTKAQNDPVTIAAMSWRDFERLIGEAFLATGFTVTGFGGSGPDGGVDLGLIRNGERFLVQCKHWRKQTVGVAVVRELNGVIAAQGAHGGFVVTGGRFTDEAQDFARQTNITLVDGDALRELCGGVRSPAARRAGAATPSCPRCGADMVRRTAKKGQFAGQHFWGCREYPKCTGIVSCGPG